MNTIGIVIWIAAAVAFAYGGYHYWAFIQKFEQARMDGKIPVNLQARRTDIVWMIASPGVVPNGDPHRRRAIYGLGAFVGLWFVFALLPILMRA
ncbi:hypothetical protein XI09_30845 [Bradyrhizobium sp. CCBAU 11386]|uniref:hypothetical protein n=1 Tax=Bradyrhizobium sp. CCBAU 11386 TaxID=1630837 RepID=UPI002302EBFA|nr:hypothetical protein [Bradyrhizobium sp. CCBAU 11386]MDA9508955.1 hypothetical protein [Bradyrhizobium sp. CCBAU 11386]